MRSLVLLLMLLLAGNTGVQAGSLSKVAERELERKGATCEALKQAEASGETHRCLFKAVEVDGRDFSTKLSRGAFVISEIGHRCAEVEILADVDHSAYENGAQNLRRVSAKCFR